MLGADYARLAILSIMFHFIHQGHHGANRYYGCPQGHRSPGGLTLHAKKLSWLMLIRKMLLPHGALHYLQLNQNVAEMGSINSRHIT